MILNKDSAVPFESIGQLCKNLAFAMPYKSKEMNNGLLAIKDAAMMTICSMVIDSHEPSTMTMGVSEMSVDGAIRWSVEFANDQDMEVEKDDSIEDVMDLKIEINSASMSEQWERAWNDANKTNETIDVLGLSDRAAGLWVWGGVIQSVKEAEKEDKSVKDFFSDTTIRMIQRTKDRGDASAMYLMPCRNNLYLRKIV